MRLAETGRACGRGNAIARAFAALQAAELLDPDARLQAVDKSEHTFYSDLMPKVEYIPIECKHALNRVQGMPIKWSVNPYSGCSHA